VFGFIVIIGIVAAIAIPAYQDYTIRAQLSEGLSLASGAKAAVWDFAADSGRLPTNNQSVGLPSASSITGKYVGSVNVAGGLVTVRFTGPSANPNLASAALLLSPTAGSGSIVWTCKGSTMKPSYLPSNCR